jgi:hypothetical protein
MKVWCKRVKSVGANQVPVIVWRGLLELDEITKARALHEHGFFIEYPQPADSGAGAVGGQGGQQSGVGL